MTCLVIGGGRRVMTAEAIGRRGVVGARPWSADNHGRASRKRSVVTCCWCGAQGRVGGRWRMGGREVGGRGAGAGRGPILPEQCSVVAVMVCVSVGAVRCGVAASGGRREAGGRKAESEGRAGPGGWGGRKE